MDDAEFKSKIWEAINKHVKEALVPTFEDLATSFVVDLFVDSKASSGFKCWMLDMDPFLPEHVSACLFEWKDFDEVMEQPEFRTVAAESTLRQKRDTSHAYPAELNSMADLDEIIKM